MRTYSPKASEINRAWHVIDAEGLVLGRLCTEVARILRGKHKPVFAPHMDMGDHVVLINVDKIVLTQGKGEKRLVHTHTGYPGGLRTETYGNLLSRKPEDAIRRSVAGMLPKGPLGRQMVKKLKVYTGPNHPHHAQNPVTLELPHAAAR
jgi:large subunit ribosomal protein L13